MFNRTGRRTFIELYNICLTGQVVTPFYNHWTNCLETQPIYNICLTGQVISLFYNHWTNCLETAK